MRFASTCLIFLLAWIAPPALATSSVANAGVTPRAASCEGVEPPLALITNGVETQGFPSVIQLRVNFDTCTGTVISRRAILTASHCLQFIANCLKPRAPESPHREALTTLQPCAKFKADDYTIEVANIYTPTTAWSKLRAGQESTTTDDLAVLELAKNLPEIFPRMGIKTSPSETQGKATLVGFGGNSRTYWTQQASGVGTKRTGTNDFERPTNDPGTIYVRGVLSEKAGLKKGQFAGAASGDSGGPLIDEQGLTIGVMSHTSVPLPDLAGLLNDSLPVRHALSKYTDLSSASSRAFFESIKFLGFTAK